MLRIFFFGYYVENDCITRVKKMKESFTDRPKSFKLTSFINCKYTNLIKFALMNVF